jgi:hypothetical protein
MKRQLLTTLILFCVVSNTFAAVPVATYQFESNFLAEEGGAPAIIPVDPALASNFVADTVFGEPRTVWEFDGISFPPTSQAGLTLDTSGLVIPTSYSVDMVFLFTQADGNWRRIIDVENRLSDNGFYVNPSNNLAVYPVSGSSASWTNNVYHHIVLTNDGINANAYIDGVSQFTAATNLMNISNPANLMHFFLDNVAGPGQGEYSDGRVALIRLWDGVLTPVEAQDLASHPFIPEPSTFALSALSVMLLGLRRR